MKKLLGVVLVLCFTTVALASQISYDQIPISPQTWEEVDLTYINTIDGKDYTEHANLLRPIIWIKQNHLDKVGSTVHLTKEQLEIDVDVKVIAIKPVKGNYSNDNSEKLKPVIATFITHSKNVVGYTFEDQYGHTEVVHAVSGHPFYSLQSQEFIPIGHFKLGEYAKSNNSRIVTLISKRSGNKEIESAHNFEVYQIHNYKVGNNNIVVHNPGGCITNTEVNRDPVQGPVNLVRAGRKEFTRHFRGRYPTNTRRTIVYRGDSRPPQLIRQTKGFHSRGLTHDYAFIHSGGASPNEAIISTSRDMRITGDYTGRDGYIYQIRLEPGQGIDLNSAIPPERNLFPFEKEMSVFGHISYEQIIGVGQIADPVSDSSWGEWFRKLLTPQVKNGSKMYYLKPVDGFPFINNFYLYYMD